MNIFIKSEREIKVRAAYRKLNGRNKQYIWNFIFIETNKDTRNKNETLAIANDNGNKIANIDLK